MRFFPPGIDSSFQPCSSSNSRVPPFLEGEDFAVVNIADFLEPHGSRQGKRGGVGPECSSIQPANASPLQFLKYPVPKLRSQARFPKLLLDCDVFGPRETFSEFFLQIHQDQCGMVKINQIEARHLVSVQGHQTQLPPRDCSRQLTAQPLRHIFNLRDHSHVLRSQNLESELVIDKVRGRKGPVKIDSVNPVDLSKINRSN